jgi:hypothetical protein
MQDARVILYHKQSTSARTRFLVLEYGGVCAFDGLPELAELIDEDGNAPSGPGGPTTHPAVVVAEAQRRLELPSGTLTPDAGFRAVVDTPQGPVEIRLLRFTTIDPPFDAAAARGARFIDITQARGIAPVELRVLRCAYEHIMG